MDILEGLTEEQKAAILQHFLPRQAVLEALRDDPPPAAPMHADPEFYRHRNQLRKELRRKLGLRQP